MAEVTEQAVLAALGRVPDPERGADVVSLGMISGLAVRDGHVGFAIEVAPEEGAARDGELCPDERGAAREALPLLAGERESPESFPERDRPPPPLRTTPRFRLSVARSVTVGGWMKTRLGARYVPAP